MIEKAPALSGWRWIQAPLVFLGAVTSLGTSKDVESWGPVRSAVPESCLPGLLVAAW